MLPNASSNKHDAIFPNRIKFPFHQKSKSTFHISADYGILFILHSIPYRNQFDSPPVFVDGTAKSRYGPPKTALAHQ